MKHQVKVISELGTDDAERKVFEQDVAAALDAGFELRGFDAASEICLFNNKPFAVLNALLIKREKSDDRRR